MTSITAETSQQRRGLFRVMRQGQTYRNLLYLTSAYPLTWIYWVVFGNGWTPAYEAGVFGVLVFLLLVLAGSWGIAIFERWLARWLLRVEFTPMSPVAGDGVSLWTRVKSHLRNPVMWKVLAYLVLKSLFGFVVPVVALVLILFSLALVLAPAVYLAAIAIYSSNAQWFDHNLVSAVVPGGPIRLSDVLGLRQSHGQIAPESLAISLAVTVLGIFVLLGVLHLLNGIVWLWGRFTRVMLGMSQKDLVVAEARAIAARERARADRAEHGRRELILNASHELRTPLASIRAHIDSLLILEGERLPENVRAFLAITQREAERLGTLVDDLLMLARADADELRLDIRPVAAGEVVEEVYEALEPLAQREREVTLLRAVAPDLPPALADRERLAQVVLNLVRNAITYTPAGGIVSIELAHGSVGYLDLTVTDTGVGIPPEELERVFDRFYRTDASRTRGSGGFGLGLSIVRDLVQAMGGSVVAERVPEGGSRFRVSLRAAPITAHAASERNEFRREYGGDPGGRG